MVNWSQSHFLQSLGWATLNSIWQMALLWCVFLAANSIFKFSAHRKCQFSVTAVMAGFAWFVLTFFYFYNTKSTSVVGFFNQAISQSNSLLNIFLISASIAYLSLLIFPAYRLFRNWRFVQRIKKEGLQKADLNYRLFVQKVSAHLGIQKKVFVYLSELVTSPVTVGYLKPIVLLPVSALSNLSVQQVEAILLHELSHVRRYDYLVNFMISIISTFLYFNPFVKMFIKNIEEERENCCDQLVVQFGYDKVGYASALLTLEKLSITQPVLAMGATGKNYLLSRIEKIVGMEKEKGFKRNQFAGLFAALFCIVLFNSVLIIKETKKVPSFGYTDLTGAFLFKDDASPSASTAPFNNLPAKTILVASVQPVVEKRTIPLMKKVDVQEQPLITAKLDDGSFMHVKFDEIGNNLTKEQKEKVKNMVDATKKVLTNLQWQQAETLIADVLTEKEKLLAKKKYADELTKTVNWNNIEQNMKAQYEQIDWPKINSNVQYAMMAYHLDSLQKSYSTVLRELNKLTAEIKANIEVTVYPLPDQSIEQLQRSKEELSRIVNNIKALRSPRKVVRL